MGQEDRDVRTEIVPDPAVVAAEWDELALRSGNIFATREWADAWWRHFGRGRRSLLHACRDGAGRCIALLPLYVARPGPVPLLRFSGHGAGDELGPICAPEDRAAAGRALSRLLGKGTLRGSILLAERLAADFDWPGALDGAVLQREASPFMALGGDWETFLGSKSRNFREQARRRGRKLAREHDVRFRLTGAPDELAGDLERLYRLHAARWAGGGSAALEPARQRFHDDWAAIALERGWLRLWTLEVDGAPVASWYGFRYAGAESYYQSGRDPSWDRASVGFVLMCRALQAACDDGMREFRLLRGDEEYKDRFSDEDRGLVTVAAGRGPVGAVAVSLARGARRPRLRPLFKRLAG
jgi:CelD/BcsL family acetyltransferase involved in cellulose biosynthesis